MYYAIYRCTHHTKFNKRIKQKIKNCILTTTLYKYIVNIIHFHLDPFLFSGQSEECVVRGDRRQKAILVRYYNIMFRVFITTTIICARTRRPITRPRPPREVFRSRSEGIFRRLFREPRIASFPACRSPRHTTLPLWP